jgi:hypothetical protein
LGRNGRKVRLKLCEVVDLGIGRKFVKAMQAKDSNGSVREINFTTE